MEPSPTGAVSLVEEYNGSSWSEVNNMPETKYYGAGAGTQTAALGTGGYGGSPETINNKTFEYDGTNWTAGGTLTVTRAFLGGTGTQTAGVVLVEVQVELVDRRQQKNMMVVLGLLVMFYLKLIQV